jgi:hypothetical protein
MLYSSKLIGEQPGVCVCSTVAEVLGNRSFGFVPGENTMYLKKKLKIKKNTKTNVYRVGIL